MKGTAAMVVHKRAEQWEGTLPFLALDEAAGFLGELATKLRPSDDVEISVSVSTGEREFRDLTVDELRDLSVVVAIESMQSLVAICSHSGEVGVRVKLTLLNDGRRTRLDVEGDEEVVVEGLFIGAKKRIEREIERVQQVEELADTNSESHGGRESSTGRLESLVIQVVGGTVAAVAAALILFLIFH